MRKILPTPGFDPRTFQPVASRHPGSTEISYCAEFRFIATLINCGEERVALYPVYAARYIRRLLLHFNNINKLRGY